MSLGDAVHHRYAPVVAWLLMCVFVAGNAWAIAELRQAAADRARLSCAGARDTRQVVVQFVNDLAPILQDQPAARQLQRQTIANMRRPPLQCEGSR